MSAERLVSLGLELSRFTDRDSGVAYLHNTRQTTTLVLAFSPASTLSKLIVAVHRSGKMMITDVLHRTFVSGLAALSVYGLFMGYAVHRETLAKGRGEMMYTVDFTPHF
ncbi:hypothetical protein EDB19DRAFT_1644032 [Suillus lakei]|nr:hypothetical protein EDB19DRAFT_1644032 [Suillus lakei]